ncbi:ester cyclase [Aneurinibacillus aneurinilyticus]|uniref:Ester cyclase n=1 Tax=Aneurinibacillus aneurinilyticus TaxID=1391 RepID=A0A848CVE6_ANEAE|nr:ester cyclase [Aneurinibacillus aneurinilyticus]NME98931.1 ester cyclase [Aneurinibacillus aneurinilyticus]
MNISELVSNKEVVENFFKAINNRQLEKLVEYMAKDVVDHNKIIHGEEDKPGAAFDGIQQQLAAFNPLHFRIDELIAENDRVVARITQSGVHTGTHPRMPIPTNCSFENEAILIFTVTNKKISEIRGVSDRLGLFLQLGWDWPTTD